jgi:hypothetical protein
MADKFGGIPVDENQGTDKFGGVAVEEAPPAGQFGRPTTPTPQMSDFLKATGGPMGPVLAGPVLPNETQLLSMALGTAGGTIAGTGARAAAKRFGAPDDVANVIGGIAGIGGGLLTGFRGNLLTRAFKSRSNPEIWAALKNVVLNKKGLGGWADLETAMNPPPQAPVPFKPSATTARSMGKYGGPADPGYGEPGTIIPRKGFTPPNEPPNTPFPKGKGTGTDYGGPTNPYANPPGTTIPRGKFSAPTEPPSTPYPPGKGTGTKYGGSENPYGGPSYRSAPGKGKLTAPTTTGEAPASQPSDEALATANEIDTNRLAKVNDIAGELKKAGITRAKAEAELSTPAQRKAVVAEINKAKGTKYSGISDISWKKILKALE